MTQKSDGGPAFPIEGGDFSGLYSEPGMRLRDWFAGQALSGLLSHSFEDGGDFLHQFGPGAAAKQAYRMADAMLAAREAGR